MSKRPRLTDLAISGRAVAKPASPAVSTDVVAVRTGQEVVAPRGRSRRPKEELATRDFKTVLARVNRDGWKELSRLSLDSDTSLQDIFIDALNEHLRANGYSPVVQSRVFPKD